MRSILLLASISFGFVSCATGTKYIYVPCPQLQTYDLNISNDEPFALKYEVRDE